MSSIKKYTKVLNIHDQNNGVCGLLSSDLKDELHVSEKNIEALSVEVHSKNKSLSKSVKRVDKKNNSRFNTEQNKSFEIDMPVVVEGVSQKNGHKKRIVQTKTNNFFHTHEKPKNGTEVIKVTPTPGRVEENSTEVNVRKGKNYKTTNVVESKITKKETIGIISPKKSPTLVTKKKKLKLSRKSEQPTEELSVNIKKSHQLSSLPQDANLKKNNSMDVFQVMMDNRKKSIGMNSPGKEIVREDDSIEVSALREIKAKRSLSLSKWADLKGAGKKREVDELHEEHVKRVLDKRAKSFKSMLLKDTPLKEKKSRIIKNAKNVKTKALIVEIECSSDSEVCLAEIQSNQNSKKRIRDFKCDSEDAVVKKTKLQSPKKNFLGSPKKVKKPPFPVERVLDSTPKKEKKAILFKQTSLDSPSSCVRKSQSPKQSFLDSSSNIKKPPAVDSTFVANLSPPLKKKESMLCYFDKKAGENEDEELVEVLYFEDVSENDCESEHSEIIKVKFKVKSKKCKVKRKSKIRKSETSVISEELLEITNNKLLTSEGTASLSKVNILTMEGTDLPDVVQEEIDLTEIAISETNGGLRLKRSIRKPIKYIQESSEDSDSDSEDYEIFSKKTKQNKQKAKKKNNSSTNKENLLQIKQNKNFENVVSPIKIVNLQSPGKLQCTRSPRTISLLKRDSAQTEALAPLFRKSIPKPIIDQSVIEARRLFLHSGVPDSIKIQVDKVSTVSVNVNYFPSISHIQQIPGESDPEYSIWNLPMSKYDADSSLLITTEEQQQFDSQHLLKDFISTSDNKKYSKNWSDMFNDLAKLNYKEGLKKLKEDFPDFPVYRTFRKLWGKYNIVPKLSGNDVENGKSNENEPDASIDCPSRNGSLWTEKYKPAASCDILGNFRSVNSLKKWLESWKEYNELSASKVSKRSRKNSDSSSDFCTSDSESKDSTRAPSNMMVVTGPPGSGKTSCVYAIANELGINVLEVNASSKRTGRKILTELQEATQSHKVLTKMNSDSSANGFFNYLGKSNEDNSQKSQSNKEFNTEKLSKKVVLSRKNCKKSSQNSLKVSNTEPLSQRSSDTNIMSLMLIDDADIVFEEDDGFVGALAQLVQSSKRPVLIVASDLNCGHLQRFLTDGNVVHFNPLYGKILGPWLDILVLIECNKLIPNLCSTLLDFNKGDIRSTLLQLQYWVLGSKKKKNSTEASSCKVPNESHLIDENSVSLSPLGDWLDDDSNLSWHKSSAKLNQEIEKSQYHVLSKSKKPCEFNLSTVLLSELSQTVSQSSLGSTWLNKSNPFSYVQENVVSEILKVVPLDVKEIKSNLKVVQADLDSLFNLFDCMSAVDMMQSCNKCNTGVKLPWQTELKDSLSESENLTMFQNHRDMSSVWCEYMIDRSSKCAKRLLNLENIQTDPAVLETEISR